jgi:hypothetical protein
MALPAIESRNISDCPSNQGRCHPGAAKDLSCFEAFIDNSRLADTGTPRTGIDDFRISVDHLVAMIQFQEVQKCRRPHRLKR